MISDMKKIYYYPSAPRGGYKNPYSTNYKNALKANFKLLDDYPKAKYTAMFSFLKYAFLADIFVLNWVEDVAFAKLHRFKFLIVYLSFLIIRLRKKKIVWMLHNMHPHKGITPMTNFIQCYLFHNADLVIAHSKAAAEFARQNSKVKVCYLCHPFVDITTTPIDVPNQKIDILIWGEILPYKGVPEFLSLPFIKQFDMRIIGRCKDALLDEKIKALCSPNIKYENRKISFDELKALIGKTRYVLFPYIGDCVSSSGALIDTLTLGGCVVGPNVGAFKDLQEEGVCLTYHNNEELFDLLKNDTVVDKARISRFIKDNSWANLSIFLEKNIG